MDPVSQLVMLGLSLAFRFAARTVGFGPRVGSAETERAWHHQRGVTPWPIDEFPDGELGRMVGTVCAHERTLRAPLSGRTCVYYMVVLEQLGRNRDHERCIEREGIPFAVVDDSGRAIIEPAGASVAMTFDHRQILHALRDATPEQDALFARHGYHLDATIKLRLHEAVISVGERVTVVGVGSRRSARVSPVESDYRHPPAMPLHIAASDSAALSIACHRAHL